MLPTALSVPGTFRGILRLDGLAGGKEKTDGCKEEKES